MLKRTLPHAVQNIRVENLQPPEVVWHRATAGNNPSDRLHRALRPSSKLKLCRFAVVRVLRLLIAVVLFFSGGLSGK